MKEGFSPLPKICSLMFCLFRKGFVFLLQLVTAWLDKKIQFRKLFLAVWRIRDVYPRSWFLPIPDPGSRISDPGSKNSNKRQGWKKFCCQTIFCSHKFHKTEYYFIFDMLKKKIWPDFPRIIEVFTQKIVTKPSKIWVWAPGSEIRDPEKTYPGSRGQKGTGSRIPDPQHWFFQMNTPMIIDSWQ